MESTDTGAAREKPPFRQQQQHKPFQQPKGKIGTNLHVSDSLSCRLCQQPHHLGSCPKFKDMDLQDRTRVYQEARACYNCLHPGHHSRTCSSRYACCECGGKHHTLLHKHRPSVQQSTLQATETASSPSDNPSVSTLTATLKNKMSVLCTFKAVLEVDRRVQAVRGILDSGSTLSFLTYRVANSLKAKKIPNVVDVSGINDSQSATCKHRMEIILKSSELPDEEPIRL